MGRWVHIEKRVIGKRYHSGWGKERNLMGYISNKGVREGG
jgi:hypothetical protein